MNILITGAGGFVGKRLTLLLAEQGHRVIAVIHSSPLPEDQRYFTSPLIDVVQQDLSQLDVGSLPEGIDALYSLAQSSHFREFPTDA